MASRIAYLEGFHAANFRLSKNEEEKKSEKKNTPKTSHFLPIETSKRNQFKQ